jgi:hypothetical protein
MRAPLALNGHAVHSIRLHVGECGAWSAECRLAEAPEIPTTPRAASLAVGDTDLIGTVIESHVFGLQLGARVVGGAGGWGSTIKRASYANDAGVKARLIAEDAAREARETIATFTPGADRVGVSYARRVATAASVLEYAAGGVAWWVDYNGDTHVGARPSSAVPEDAYIMIAYDPAERVAILAVNDFAAIAPGRVIHAEALPGGSAVIRDVELESVAGGPLRATVWCGAPTRPGVGRLGSLLRTVVSRLTGARLHGVYRYRVVAMRGDRRVDLQAVRAGTGLPDLPAVSQCPGVPGTAAELTDGVEVLVTFVDGDPAEPLITHYAGPGATGFAPVGLILGGESGEPAARQGDTVEVLLPPATFVGTINALPATGAVTFLMPKANGVITGGSGRVRVAT